MTTSIVIPVFNGLAFLKANLKSMMALNSNEVIIVDDASSDGSTEFVEKNFPEIVLIKHAKNTRFPAAVNDGFARATGDVVYLFNQDVKPDKHLIKLSLTHFSDPQVFAVTFNEQLRSWAQAKFKNGFLEFTNGVLDENTHESFWASGGSAAFRHSMWNKLGGFDTIFTPGYYEDLDLGWRAHKAGYKILWDPKSIVEHETETSFAKTFTKDKLQKIKERNYLLAHWKNMTTSQWLQHLWYLPLRIIRHPGYFIPVIQAICQKLVS